MDLSGTDLSGAKARIIGVAVTQFGRMWFFKLMGDEATVEKQKENFIDFVKSAKYSNVP